MNCHNPLIVLHFYHVRSLNPGLVGICLIALMACAEIYTDDNQDDPATQNLVPTELWLRQALEAVETSYPETKTYSVYMASSNKSTETELHFDRHHQLLMLAQRSDGMPSGNLYFDQGRATFSYHKDGKQSWIVAYANNQAYAAAEKLEGNWNAAGLNHLPFSIESLQDAAAKAIKFEKYEAARPHTVRIYKPKERIDLEFGESKQLTFLINARAGERVQIRLNSHPSGSYFILKPNNGSNMEQHEWHGLAAETGDMELTVFKNETEGDPSITLEVEKTSSRNQGFAQAPLEVQASPSGK